MSCARALKLVLGFLVVVVLLHRVGGLRGVLASVVTGPIAGDVTAPVVVSVFGIVLVGAVPGGTSSPAEVVTAVDFAGTSAFAFAFALALAFAFAFAFAVALSKRCSTGRQWPFVGVALTFEAAVLSRR